MMFDGAVNTNNYVLYENILRLPLHINNNNNNSKNKTNATSTTTTTPKPKVDVCPIRGTFFVKHDYNNYHNVEQVKWVGHEGGC